MAALSDKLLRILRANAPFSDEQLALMTEKDGWDWVYAHRPAKRHIDEICFTGFGAVECQELVAMAEATGWLKVVTAVTTKLAYLVVGANAGPAKLAKAQARQVPVISRALFERLVQDGEVPVPSPGKKT